MTLRATARGVIVAAVLIAVAVGAWLLVNSRGPTRQEMLVRDLGATESWYYRWLEAMHRKDIAKGRRSRVPAKLAQKASRAEYEAWTTRLAAKQELIKVGTNAWPAIPMLLNTLDSTDLGVRIYAAEVLAGIGAERHPLWRDYARRLEGRTKPGEAFLHLLKGRNEFGHLPYNQTCRLFALHGLETAGPAASVALPQLIEICGSGEDYKIRAGAVTAIASVGGGDAKVVAVLRNLMANPDEWPQVRSAAMQALAKVTPADTELPKQLREALSDKSGHVRVGAAAALWRLGVSPDEILPVLTNALTHKLATVRLASLQVMGEMEKPARPAEAAVRQLISDENETVRAAAGAVLEKMQ